MCWTLSVFQCGAALAMRCLLVGRQNAASCFLSTQWTGRDPQHAAAVARGAPGAGHSERGCEPPDYHNLNVNAYVRAHSPPPKKLLQAL